jgi:hypothetical protein
MYTTERFWKKYTKLNVLEKSAIVRELENLNQGLYSAKNITALSKGKIGEVSSTLSFTTLKVRLSLAGRIVFRREPQGDLCLLDFDFDHTAVDDLEGLSKSELKRVFENFEFREELSTTVNKGRGGEIARSFEYGNRDLYVEELGNCWIRFLDAEQERVCESLVASLLSGRGAGAVHVVLGGAGTGKTMVILETAWRLLHIHDTQVQLDLPSGVRDYLSKSEDDYWWQQARSGPLLLDDPSEFSKLETAKQIAEKSGQPLVVAIDPTQWTNKRSRTNFADFLETTEGLIIHELRLAYRQGGALGRETLKLVTNFYDKSSMFSGKENIEEERSRAEKWENLCLKELNHVDERGALRLEMPKDPDELVELLDSELTLIGSFETYRSWPKVLIGTYGRYFPKGFSKAVSRHNVKTSIVPYKEVQKVRGTEFEAVVVFISQKTAQELKGQIGLNNKTYPALTAPLTFLTRAENRLAIFEIPDGFPAEDLNGSPLEFDFDIYAQL